MLLSDSVCLSVVYIGRNSRTERTRKTKIGTEVAHVTRDSDTAFRVKGQGHQAALVGCTGMPTWTYSSGDLSIRVHDVYRVTTCRPGRGISCTAYSLSSGSDNADNIELRTVLSNCNRVRCRSLRV